MDNKMAPVHPGEIPAKEFLNPMGMTQHRLVISNGVLLRWIDEIVRGARRITTGTFLWGEAAILDHFVVALWPQNREVLGVAGKARP